LLLCALVDGLGDEFAVAVEDEGLGDALDVELLVDGRAGVEQDGGPVAGFGQKLTSTTLPRRSESLTGLPLRSCKVNSAC
jgi:hypothetical protein